MVNDKSYSIEENKETFFTFLSLFFKIPDIKNVYKYVELFFDLSVDQYDVLYSELSHLIERLYTLLIGYSIYIVESYDIEEQCSYAEKIKNEFKGLYNFEDYFIELKGTDEQIAIANKIISLM
ncbi:hypothetical protein [Tepidibacter formicigenes]|uniref:Uncharacterized protein n=1 Tax=Tepidibacter formicigenes DSM 15518 TaxID=1123349 RepID=A0A1M6QJU3_9FIRM|nr:hypothetical protein [Tepidibacter formicigenes]SHK20438.1 hypothetical protein SAMN02744037_01870 [Tepidibacter formicigenes DSM 15518]